MNNTHTTSATVSVLMQIATTTVHRSMLVHGNVRMAVPL